MRRSVSRLIRLCVTYTLIAWVGLFVRRSKTREPLELVQGVVLSERGVVLSARSDLWGWELPGGRLHSGESPSDGLCREIFEETGLCVDVESFVGEYVRTGFFAHRARVYRCRVRPGKGMEPHAQTETLAADWFDTNALPVTIFPWCRAPLADGLQTTSAPVVRREHHGLREIAQSAWIDLRMRFGGGFTPVWEKEPIAALVERLLD